MTKRYRTKNTFSIARLHENQRHTMTRRELLARGLVGGLGLLAAPSLLGLFGGAREAFAAIDCGSQTVGATDPAFLCFDLAGGGNIAGSNVMVGATIADRPVRGNQTAELGTPGYNKLGIAGDALPSAAGMMVNLLNTAPASGELIFHSKSALLAGIRVTATDQTLANVNGCVICARSNDDTQNNPHNPMYGLAKSGVKGSILALVGNSSSVSGGNSVAPGSHIEAKFRPTKIASGTDAQGLVDSGKLGAQLAGSGAEHTMSLVQNLVAENGGVMSETQIVQAAINKAYSDAGTQVVCNSGLNINVTADAQFIGGTVNGQTVTGIFPAALGKSLDPAATLLASTRTAAVKTVPTGDMLRSSAVAKLVVDGYAGAGTVQLGGFDYHTGDRVAGDKRDMVAGFAIGAALEYARIKNRKLMIYVFSDGAVSSDGKVDGAADANGKLVWTSDNGSCAATLMLVYDPASRPPVSTNQLGGFASNGSVDSKAAAFSNSVQTLTETVILNYLAFSGKAGQFNTFLPGNSLSSVTNMNDYIAFG